MEAPRCVLYTCKFFLQMLKCQTLKELALGMVVHEQAAQQLFSLAIAFLGMNIPIPQTWWQISNCSKTSQNL